MGTQSWIKRFLKKIFSQRNMNDFEKFFFYVEIFALYFNLLLNLCIMRAAAENSFARVLNPHGEEYLYIYITWWL